MRIYEFRTQLLTPTDTPPLVAKASRAEVERFIPLAEFGPLFGGYILWAPPEPPTADMPALRRFVSPPNAPVKLRAAGAAGTRRTAPQKS